MHSVSIEYRNASDIKKLAQEIIEYILYACKTLLPNDRWLNIRLEHLENSTSEILSEEPDPRLHLCYEVCSIIRLLNRDIVRTYFDIDKKAKHYYCPKCYDMCSNENEQFKDVKLAYLKTVSKVYCPICDETYDVCLGKQTCCKDNIVYSDMCINCGNRDQ